MFPLDSARSGSSFLIHVVLELESLSDEAEFLG